MIGWLSSILNPGWKYVGSVVGHTQLVSGDNALRGGLKRGEWILEESRQGKRRATLIGDPGHSAAAIEVRAGVKKWLVGGPFPPTCEINPTPPKHSKRKLNLVSFPGGKGGA